MVSGVCSVFKCHSNQRWPPVHPCKWHFFHSISSSALKIYTRGPSRGNALKKENGTEGAAKLSSLIYLRRSPRPSLCGNQTSAANLWLTFDSKWGYRFPRNNSVTGKMKHWHFWMWLSRQMDRCTNGFMPRWIHATSREWILTTIFWLNHSHMHTLKNTSNSTTYRNTVSLGGLTATNLNVATTEELKSIRVEEELSGNKEAARWMDIRVFREHSGDC